MKADTARLLRIATYASVATAGILILGKLFQAERSVNTAQSQIDNGTQAIAQFG